MYRFSVRLDGNLTDWVGKLEKRKENSKVLIQKEKKTTR